MEEIKKERMLASLSPDVTLSVPDNQTDSVLQYMGMRISKTDLYGMDELLNMLNRYGGVDSTLDKVRDTYAERFGNQLIWKYPISENMQGGGAIIPVREGFLFLPYNSIYPHEGARYQLTSAELLTTDNIRTLQKECETYVEGLLAALGDMEKTMQPCPIRRYADAQGNLYFVRGGLGGVFKGFRRYADPKPGQRRESGIRALNYVTNFSRAQFDLDQYAKKHHLRELETGDEKKGDEQND